MSNVSTRGRPLATEKRAATALSFEWLLPELGKRLLTREVMAIDTVRFPSAPSCERSIRRDLEAQHNPVTELLDGAQHIHCDSIGDGWASLIESIERLERVHGKTYVCGFGWHWREGGRQAQHCSKQLHIDEPTFQLLSKSRSGCVLIISVHGRQITTNNFYGSLGT